MRDASKYASSKKKYIAHEVVDKLDDKMTTGWCWLVARVKTLSFGRLRDATCRCL